MHDLIFHHYDGSPFSEKVRLMLGYKGLGWLSVKVPPIMPKPDVLALTGGYRKTPVMQVGADVYCDTALIARLLEARQPQPTLFPADAPLAPLLAQWADSTLFWTVIPYAMQPAGAGHIFKGLPPEAIKAFAADRAPFTAGMVRQTATDAAVNLAGYLATLEAQLADGEQGEARSRARPETQAEAQPQAQAGVDAGWLSGARASIADFSVAHCLWYVRRAGPMAEILGAYPRVNAWLERVLAIGHGSPQPLTSTEAVAIAAAARSHAAVSVEPALGFEAGQRVTVSAVDYGQDPVAGSLVGLSPHEVVVARDDDRAGRVHVHFPRRGFQVRQEKA